MKADTARFLASAVVVAMAAVFVILLACKAPFSACLATVIIAIFAGFVASTQPT